MPSVTAVVTAHGPESQVAGMVAQLQAQTSPPDEILVYASDVPDDALKRLDVDVRTVPNRNDWGHEKRAQGLADATSQWVGFFNDDDQYDPAYLQAMTDASGGFDLVMCPFESRGFRVSNPQPRVGSCTAGNFIVNTRLARTVGWAGRHYEADGQFIADVVAAGARWTVLNRTLYWHR